MKLATYKVNTEKSSGRIYSVVSKVEKINFCATKLLF